MLFIVQSPYWSTIGRRGVLSLGGWTPHVHAGFHEPDATLWLNDSLQGFHLLRPRIPTCSLRLIRFRSPLLTESRLISFPPGTEMFQFPGFALLPYAFRQQYSVNRVGFPIRRSTDHSLVTSSLWLIAGSNVLHRLSTPRHPPCALSRLITPTCRRERFQIGSSAPSTASDPPEGFTLTGRGLDIASMRPAALARFLMLLPARPTLNSTFSKPSLATCLRAVSA